MKQRVVSGHYEQYEEQQAKQKDMKVRFDLVSVPCLTGKCNTSNIWRHRKGKKTRESHKNGQTYVVFVEGEVVRGQHSDSQTRAQCCIQEITEDCLIL